MAAAAGGSAGQTSKK